MTEFARMFAAQRKPPAPKKPKPKKNGLPRVGKKRRKLNEEVNPERRKFVEDAKVCMCCCMARATQCHEIARGVNRERALQEPRLWLAVCPSCHDTLGSKRIFPPIRQLAIRVRWEINESIAALIDTTSRCEVSYDDLIAYL